MNPRRLLFRQGSPRFDSRIHEDDWINVYRVRHVYANIGSMLYIGDLLTQEVRYYVVPHYCFEVGFDERNKVSKQSSFYTYSLKADLSYVTHLIARTAPIAL